MSSRDRPAHTGADGVGLGRELDPGNAQGSRAPLVSPPPRVASRDGGLTGCLVGRVDGLLPVGVPVHMEPSLVVEFYSR
jgi:hypothetical protein